MKNYELQRMTKNALITLVEEQQDIIEQHTPIKEDPTELSKLKQSLEVANSEAAGLSESLRASNAKGQLAYGLIYKILMTFQNQLDLLTELAQNYGFVRKGE